MHRTFSLDGEAAIQQGNLLAKSRLFSGQTWQTHIEGESGYADEATKVTGKKMDKAEEVRENKN